jgi:hypothetical protein
VAPRSTPGASIVIASDLPADKTALAVSRRFFSRTRGPSSRQPATRRKPRRRHRQGESQGCARSQRSPGICHKLSESGGSSATPAHPRPPRPQSCSLLLELSLSLSQVYIYSLTTGLLLKPGDRSSHSAGRGAGAAVSRRRGGGVYPSETATRATRRRILKRG